MTLKTVNTENFGSSANRIFASTLKYGPRITFEAEGVASANPEDNADKEQEKIVETVENKVETNEEQKSKNKPTDAEAELLREVMDKKTKLREAQEAVAAANARLKEFDGIDPVEVRALLQAKKDAEKAALEAKGDFDRVKQMMADEHAKEKEVLAKTISEKDDALKAAQRVIDDLTIGAAFTGSTFVSSELVLTPAKARTVYGDHFEVEDGRVVAYDKPKSSPNRTKLVDSSGEPVGFEDAIKRLVDSDPDRDQLIRSKLKEGAGSKTTDAKQKPTVAELRGIGRIAMALEKKSLNRK